MLNNGFCFRTGFIKQHFPAVGNLRMFAFQGFLVFFDLPQRFFQLAVLLFRFHELFFQPLHQSILIGFGLLFQKPGVVYDCGGKAAAFCDRQRVRLSGNALEIPVRWPQGCFIKFNGCDKNIVMPASICFQPTVMCRRNHRSLAFAQFIENRDRKAFPFSRIRAAADLIKQDQGMLGCLTDHLRLLFNMRGKRAEGARHGLIIADIRKYPVKKRDVRCIGRHRHTAVGHQRKQTKDFHGYGFTAGIRAGNQ